MNKILFHLVKHFYFNLIELIILLFFLLFFILFNI